MLDSRIGACSATGDGEAIIRATLARTAVELMRGGKDPTQAARTVLDIFKKQTQGEAGLIFALTLLAEMVLRIIPNQWGPRFGPRGSS